MRTTKVLLLCLLGGVLACGDDAEAPSLRVEVFGYGPDYMGGEGFVSGLPDFTDMQTVNVSLTQPLDRRLLNRESFVASSGTGKVPEVTFGQNLRLDLEVLNGMGQVVASGSTPRFDFAPEDEDLSFRIQVAATNSFTPIGSVVLDSATQERRFTQSRFDYRAMSESSCETDSQCGPSATCTGTPKTCKTWLGRIGHSVAQLSDGRILVAGGGDPTPGAAPTTLPKFRTMTVDLQFFEPSTGYFTEAGFDSAGNDRFDSPFVHGTMTPIGEDRFVVAGGFTKLTDGVVAIDSIYLVDAKAAEGERVRPLMGSDGQVKRLKVARGWHAASYRGEDNSIIFSGGIGILGDDDVLNTFEILNLTTGDMAGPFNMSQARAEHSSVTMGDGRSIWLLGGRNATEATATTEVITGQSTAAEVSLGTARFGHGAVRISTSPNASLVMVIGGYTDLDGATTGRFEIGGLGRGNFQAAANWALASPRGRPLVFELPVSRDIVVLGGRSEGNDVEATERLVFKDLTDALPYEPRSAGSMSEHRYQGSGLVMSSGKVFLVGGVGLISGSVAARDSATLYNANDPVLP